MSNKKPASLTGSLVARDSFDRSRGFVLKPLQDGDGARKRSRPKQTGSVSRGEDKSGPELCASGSSPGGAGRTDGPVAPQRATTSLKPPNALSGPTGGMLTTQHLVEALHRGDCDQAEAVFRELSGLAEGPARNALYDPEGRDLAIACRAIGIEQLQFASIFILSRKVGLGQRTIDPRQLTDIFRYFSGTSQEAARSTLKQWQTSPGEYSAGQQQMAE